MALTSFSFSPNTLPTHQIADATPLPGQRGFTYGLVAKGTSGRQKAWRPTIIGPHPDGHKMVIGVVRAATRYGRQGFVADVKLPRPPGNSNGWMPYTGCFVPTQDLAVKVMRLLIEELYP